MGNHRRSASGAGRRTGGAESRVVDMIRSRRLPRRFFLLATAALLLTACAAGGGASVSTPPSRDAASASTAPDRAGPVDIGGREIYLECHGSGSPTVILVSGLGDGADVWSTPASGALPSPGPSSSASDPASPTVYSDVAAFTRVCAYDRPGTAGSRSGDVPQPTSAQTSADDLEKLLRASGEGGPFVLVGHSYGGPIVRLFASDHPDQVSGLVLVDALSEDLDAGLTPAQRTLFAELNAPPPTPGAEYFEMTTLVTELRESPPAPDVPVIVLTADIPQLTPEVLASGQLPPGVDQEFADALWAAQLAAQDELAARFPEAVHVTQPRSDHYIQLGNPQLVIDSIREVVDDAARAGRG
jgi:pimeloyl-ACP methyl ester carboxylesterase